MKRRLKNERTILRDDVLYIELNRSDNCILIFNMPKECLLFLCATVLLILFFINYIYIFDAIIYIKYL